MLNRHKVFQELQFNMPKFFLGTQQERVFAYEVWQLLVADEQAAHMTQECFSQWSVPLWHEHLGTLHVVQPQALPYKVISVDGSQIYPDRHQGISCYLLNIGSTQLHYKAATAEVLLNSIPTLHGVEEEHGSKFNSTDVIDSLRSELELSTGLELMKQAQENSQDPMIFLSDGSLICWHIEGKDPKSRDAIVKNYIAVLEQFYRHKLLLAGYISLPKSRELVAIIKTALLNRLVNTSTLKSIALDHLVDADIATFFLQPWTRSTLFEHRSSIVQYYPEHLKPYFFYLRTDDEIVRIEIPAWIAADQVALQKVIGITVDQIIKGYGYPVVLAEAHEQAVVKSADREYFYQILYTMSITHNQRYALSQKSMKKRFIGI